MTRPTWLTDIVLWILIIALGIITLVVLTTLFGTAIMETLGLIGGVTSNASGGSSFGPLGLWIFIGFFLFFISFFLPKKPSIWIRWGTRLAGLVIFGAAYLSTGFGTQYFKYVEQASVCAASPTLPECVIPTDVVCPRESIVIPVGDTVVFQRKNECHNLKWNRVKGSGSILNATFTGDGGVMEETWGPGARIMYDGDVETVTLENCGDEEVKIIFSYHI